MSPSVFSLEGLSQAQLSLMGAPAPQRPRYNLNASPIHPIRRQTVAQQICQPGYVQTPYGCRRMMPQPTHFGASPVRPIHRQNVAQQLCPPGKVPTPYGCQQAMPKTSFGDSMVTVNFPAYGSPLAPHGAPIGPPRPETPVFGPGGTPIMYRRHFPDRGPVVDYCQPEIFVGPGGSSNGNLGDVSDFIGSQSPAVGTAMVVGATLAFAAALAGGAVFILGKVGHRSMARK